MDGHPRQNPAYRPATSKPRESGASTLTPRGTASAASGRRQGGLFYFLEREQSRNSETLFGTGMPARSPGEGTGFSNDVVIGSSPAQMSSAASSLSSSSGGPERTFAAASSIVIARIVVAFSSFSLGGRTSLHRPGRILSVNASSAASVSAGSSTGVKRPKATTDS